MKPQPHVPNVSLVIHLAPSEQTTEGALSLAPLLSELDLPATWVTREPTLAKVLADRLLAANDHRLAMTVAARSPQRLRSEVSNLQAAVLGVSGQDVSVVVGDPQQLRSRAALLAELGIVAVVSDSQSSGPSKPPRQLPCGLWQFDPAMSVPQPRHRWSWLTARQPTLKQLLYADTPGSPKVVAIDLGRVNARELQGCEHLLQEIAEAGRLQQLQVATVSELAAELANQREVKPQRSILRRAA